MKLSNSRANNLLRIIILLSLLPASLVAVESEVYYDNEVHTCKSNEYFDVDYLKCKKCETELNLVPSKDKLSCVCFPVSSEKAYYDNLEQHSICDTKCPNCAANNATVVKEPMVHCSLLFFNLTSIRQQSKNIKMYRLFDENSTSSPPTCECDEKTNLFYRGVYCIPNAYLKEYSSYNVMTISRTIKENMKALSFLCHTMKLKRECNYLANLCVLMEYSLDRQSPCYVFYQAQINDYTSESTRRIKPNLFYKKGRNTLEDINKKLDQSYIIRKGLEERQGLGLNFSILEFNLRGDLLKFGKSNLKFLNFCGMKNGYVEIFFPKNIRLRCQVSLEETIEHIKEITFQSIFVQYDDGKMKLLKRIPVLIRNLFDNRKADGQLWQYVSRFYLVDTISGHRPGHFDNLYSERNMVKKFESVRYLTRAELRFEVRDLNKIETPVLILEYNSVNLSAITGFDFLYDFEFRVNFEKSLKFDTLLQILLPILLILGLIFAIIETISFKTREGQLLFNTHILIRFIVQFLSKIANALLIVAAGLAVYIHIVYKTQKTVKVLLPDSIEEEIKYFLIVALCLKLVKLVEHFWRAANIDIFFVDWERPKLSGGGVEAAYYKNHHLETPSSVGSRQINLESNVSAWRNYFVANEWQELATKRPISVFLHLFFLLAALNILGMENFASSLFYFHLARHDNMQYEDDGDVLLNLSTGIMAYLICYAAQWLFNYAIWERYVKNPIQQFIDVCSIANVSVFLLSQRCYGYYIHGRSPHGFSDTDMCSMILQFKREEDNMCGHRGLLPGSEQQTYRVLAPKNLRAFYDRLVLPLHKPAFFAANLQRGAAATTTNQQSGNNGIDYANKLTDRYSFERTLNTYQSINRFFMAFIDHSLKELDYVVRERTILEHILNTELELSAISDDRGIFYMDNGHSFVDVLFYGSEFLLFQVEILLFSVVICLSGSFNLAIVLVGLTYKVLQLTMQTASKYNLARKTLIDNRFLI